MKLIINADDFGLTNGVNRGIIDCFLAGSVTSTTLMVNTPATLEAVALAKANPELVVGLHFNLTLGRPLCRAEEVPTLIDGAGEFRGRAACERNLLLGKVKGNDIEREFHAQVERFTSFGIPLTHIDSHQHMHLFPRVFDIVASYCVKHDIPLRLPWVWQGKGKTISLRKKIRALLLSLLVRRNAWRWQGRIRTNRAFASVFDLGLLPEEICVGSYLHMVEDQRSPLEIMVHPAHVDRELKSLTRISEISAAEYDVLSQSCIADDLLCKGWHLAHYGTVFSK